MDVLIETRSILVRISVFARMAECNGDPLLCTHVMNDVLTHLKQRKGNEFRL